MHLCEADAKGRSVAKMEIQVQAYVGNGNQGDEVLGLYLARTRLKQLCFKGRPLSTQLTGMIKCEPALMSVLWKDPSC